VAVRSSALDEDSQNASFAGQHQTFLNIRGIDALSQAVIQCWASAYHPSALAYRRQHGLNLNPQMAVLVQQLIPADVSAVVFTANPVTGDRGEILINAAWGLGESLVSGEVTPDEFVVRKDMLSVISRQVADKQIMTVLAPVGVKNIPVPRLLRGQPSLSTDQIAEIARLGLRLEEIMGQPVDVECAYRGGFLYLLQCRPITTL
jgi:pyruvate,water dikinase